LPIANFRSLEQTETLKQQLQQAVSNNPDYRSISLLYR